MKKSFSLLLILALSLVLFACSNKKEPKTKDNPESISNEKERRVILPEIEEQVIYDEHNVTVKTKKGKPTIDYSGSILIPISVANKNDKDVDIDIQNVKVNGITVSYDNANAYQCQAMPNLIAASAKIRLSSDILRIIENNKLGDIKFDLVLAIEGEDEIIKKDLEIVTSLSGKTEQKFKPKGKTLYNKNGIKLIVAEKLYDLDSGKSMRFYFVNESDSFVNFISTGKYLINGTDIHGGFSFALNPSEKMITEVLLMNMTLEENKIKLPIKSIYFSLKGTDAQIMGNEIIEAFKVNLEFQN